jgi:hypothetical protein
MTTSNKTTARFIVDFINKKIVGTKASFDKASKGISPIYEELTMKTKAHPTFALEVKEAKHKSDKPKRTYDGLNFAFIVDYIKTKGNRERLMADYQAVRLYAEEQKMSVYPFVKKWFLGEFDPDGEGFDMAKAEKEISDWKISEAVMNASTETTENDIDTIISIEEKKGA